MEVGNGMLFASNVVDGMVHTLGGRSLEWECKWVRWMSRSSSFRHGSAVATSSGRGNDLCHMYDQIIHTFPPFYNHHQQDDNREIGTDDVLLRSCYQQSLQLAIAGWDRSGRHDNPSSVPILRVACPLLGAGCRGFPTDVAIHVAATELQKWLRQTEDDDDDNDDDYHQTDGDNDDSNHKSTADEEIVCAFGIPDPGIAETLVKAVSM